MEQGIDDRSLPEVSVDKFSFDEDVLRKEVVAPIAVRIQEAVKADDKILRDVNLYRLVHVFRETVRALPERKETVMKVIFESFRKITGEDEESALQYMSQTQSLYDLFTFTNDVIPHHERVSFVSLAARKEDAEEVEDLAKDSSDVESEYSPKDVAIVALSEKWIPSGPEVQSHVKHPKERQVEKELRGAITFSMNKKADAAVNFLKLAEILDRLMRERPISTAQIEAILFRLVCNKYQEDHEAALKADSKTRQFLAGIPDYSKVKSAEKVAVPVVEQAKAAEVQKLPDEGIFFVQLESRVAHLLRALLTDGGEDDIAAYREINQLVNELVAKNPEHTQRIYDLLFEAIRENTGESEQDSREGNSRAGRIYGLVLSMENGIDHVAPVAEEGAVIDDGRLFIIPPYYKPPKPLSVRARLGQKFARVFQGESAEVEIIKEVFSWPEIKRYADKATDDLLFECFRAPVIYVKGLGIKISQLYLVNCLGQKKYDQLMWDIFDWIFDSNRKRIYALKRYGGRRSEDLPLYAEDGGKTIFRSLTENDSLRISPWMRGNIILELLRYPDYADFFLQNRDKCRHWTSFVYYEREALYSVYIGFCRECISKGHEQQDIKTCWRLHSLGVKEPHFKEGMALMKEKGLTAEEVARYLERKRA